MNGTTSKDRTLYFETLPSNQLDLGLYLEADRMRSLAITKDNLDNQRNAVQEERRLGVDNQPYGKTFDTVDELAYDNPAYEHSVIGSMADLNAATVDDVFAFFKTYYAPNNAVLAIVGDVDAKTTLDKVKKAFEPIPSQPSAPKVDMTEPKQAAERRQTLDDSLARLTRLDMVFKVPARMTPDDDAVQVLGTVLGSRRSSRLYQIVREQQLAPNISSGRDGSVGPGLFRIIAIVAPGKTAEALEAAIYAEIEKVKISPPADWEVEKARNNAKRGVVGGLTSSLTRAIQLADFAANYNNAGLINSRIERIAKVTAADVQRVAQTYLVQENRTVVRPCRNRPGAEGRLVMNTRIRWHAFAGTRPDGQRGVRGCTNASHAATAAIADQGRRGDGQSPGIGQDPASEDAEAAGSRLAKRHPPDGARGSTRPANRLQPDHPRRWRLLRSGRPLWPGAVHRCDAA